MVKMYHDNPEATGGPKEADVPEGGIPMMRKAGWYTKEQETGDQPPKTQQPDFSQMSVKDMRTWAQENNIEIPDDVKGRDEIVAYLSEKNQEDHSGNA